MKIVLVSPFFPFRGGIAHFSGCLYRELIKQGHETHVLNFKYQYPTLFFPGQSQFEINSAFNNLPSERVLTPYNPLSYPKALKKITSLKPDVVIFSFFIPYLVPAYLFLVKRLVKSGIKNLVIAHNIDFHERWFLSRKLTESLLKKSDCIVTLSDSVYQDAVRITEKESSKAFKLFHPLYDFYNREAYTSEQALEKLGLTGRKVVLFYGYIKPYKGLDILIESFSIIKNNIKDAVLLIVGEVYGDKAPYIEQIQKSPCSGDIFLMDKYVDNTETELYFKAADVLAVPYKQATQSGVIQIAYSMNKGVVVTPAGGLPEMVHNGKTGVISHSFEPKDFAAAIIEYFSLDRNAISSYITQYKKNFSWAEFVQRLVDII